MLSFVLTMVVTCSCAVDITRLWASQCRNEIIPRPWWSGPITIEFDQHNPRKVTEVAGILLPMATGGRRSAPDPLIGAIARPLRGQLDKGHLIALQLGGPDISQNIVPQPSKWQQTGEWRHLERYLYLASRWLILYDEYDADFNPFNHPPQHTPTYSLKYTIKPVAWSEPIVTEYHGSIQFLFIKEPLTAEPPPPPPPPDQPSVAGKPGKKKHWDIEEYWTSLEPVYYFRIAPPTSDFKNQPKGGFEWKDGQSPPDWVDYMVPSQHKRSMGATWKNMGVQLNNAAEEWQRQIMNQNINYVFYNEMIDDVLLSMILIVFLGLMCKVLCIYGTGFTIYLYKSGKISSSISDIDVDKQFEFSA